MGYQLARQTFQKSLPDQPDGRKKDVQQKPFQGENSDFNFSLVAVIAWTRHQEPLYSCAVLGIGVNTPRLDMTTRRGIGQMRQTLCDKQTICPSAIGQIFDF